jgi:hypothetical protein
MKAILNYQNLMGGNIEITYRTKNFHLNEYFRVLVNGKVQHSSNSDNKPTLRPSRGDSKYSSDEAFLTLRTKTVPYGNNSIEISVLSEFETFDPNFKSKA